MGKSQGIAGKSVTHKPVRTGVGARGVNKQWVSQIGQSMGNHITEGRDTLRCVRAVGPYKGPNFNPVPQGNAVAAATKCGPGGSREIFKSGGQHGLMTRANNPRGRSFDD
jgi:hypothetical protein